MNPCNHCREAKAQKEPIAKVSDRKPSTKANELIFMDSATIKKPRKCTTIKKLTKPIWNLLVDDYSELGFDGFYDTKDGIVEPTCELLHQWKQDGKPVKSIRCDNAGENRSLQARLQSKDWKMNIKFQYTARATPQQNSPVEKKFHTITGRGDSMMNAANLGLHERCLLFKEAYSTALLLDGLVLIIRNEE